MLTNVSEEPAASFFKIENGGSMFLQNTGNYLQNAEVL
jgi:hypothetical protein